MRELHHGSRVRQLGQELITHFYHAYTAGKWQEPAEEHAKALADSGLRDRLDHLFLGIVGEDDRGIVEMFRDYGLDPIVRAHTGLAWEQLTLSAIYRYVTTNKGYIFYAHTKSAHDQQQINLLWRRDMCYQNVIRWRECVEKLDEGYDIVGAHYIDDRDQHHGLGHRFFGGNYWWANSVYIKRLPPLIYQSRWCAEWWIGERDHKHFDMNPGWPHPSNFVTEW